MKFLEVFRNEAAKTVKNLIVKLINNQIGKIDEEPDTETRKTNLNRKSTAVK